MSAKRRVIFSYIIVCTLSEIAVLFFAFVQYSLVQGHEFILSNYLIPALVGLIFGYLLARNIILSNHLKIEQEIIIEKNKKIRSFTGTIVHDLKNPVSAIMGLTGILLTKKDELDEKALEYLVSALGKSISIERKIDKDLPNVSYDKNALDHIISNLISNAFKYSPPKTQVEIYSELLSDHLKIVVQDQGLGMTDVDLDGVFTEFKTLSARPTGTETSTGLGLSIDKPYFGPAFQY